MNGPSGAADVAAPPVACIGAGTIGSGWIALFLSRGLRVTCWDPAPAFRDKVRALVDEAWPALARLGHAEGADRANLTFCATLEEAVSAAEFVQESAPDREDLKVDLLARISRGAPASALIASSSSSFRPSVLGAGCVHPERVVVGHPFVPSYLIPLVEVVAAPGAPGDVVRRAEAFYARLGKHVVTLRRECDAYVGNRLQAALVAEATRLVDEGVCGYEDVDAVVVQSVGIRWAFMGPGLSTHVAGGKGGIAATHAQFGWRASETSRRDLLGYLERAYGAIPMDALERWRDDNVLGILASRTGVPGAQGPAVEPAIWPAVGLEPRDAAGDGGGGHA